METIKKIQASLNEVIEFERELVKRQERFNLALSKVASETGLAFYGSTNCGRYDSERRIKSLIEDASRVVLRLFLKERKVNEDVIEDLEGYSDIKMRVAETGDLVAFYSELEALLPEEQASDVASKHAATELARRMRLGKWRWRGNGIEFDIWTDLTFDGSYNYYAAASITQAEQHLRTFMKRRGLPWHVHNDTVDVLKSPVVSRTKIVIANDAGTDDRIELVTYKSKVTFRIIGELAHDYFAWVRKYADQEQVKLAA